MGQLRSGWLAVWATLVWACHGAAGLASAPLPSPYHPADMVLWSGKIVTLDAQSRVAEALAIRDGRIVAVGSNQEMVRWIGPQTRVIDLAGRTVIPGLIDSHFHGIRAGITYTAELDWSGVRSLEEALATIREAARQSPAGTWIVVAGGWHEAQLRERRGPTPAELTEAAPDHPVYVQHLYQYAVLNAKAMERLGLNRDTPDPPMGRYQRDANGNLTGVVTGNITTFTYFYDRLPKAAVDEQVASTKAFFRQLNRLGLTGFIDAAGSGILPEHYDAVYRLWRSGQLTLRVRYYINPQVRGKEMEELQERTSFLRSRTGDDMLRFEGFGEALLWETHDGTNYGLKLAFSADAKEKLYQIAGMAAERGLGIQAHATNDYSARQFLDVFERVNREVPIAGLRWYIVHLEDLTAETMDRLKALGMGISVQDRLYFDGDRYLRVMGEPAARRAPPIRTALRAGLVVGAGTDAHRVAPYNPFVSLWWLVTGKSVSGRVIRGPEETPTREEALRMYTWNSAWLSGEETTRGSLEVGKWADLVVLSKDYFTVPEDEIREIESVLTMVGGRVVYASDWFRPLER